MLYGLYAKKGVFMGILTRSEVLEDDDDSPWLTTSKEEAKTTMESLRDRYSPISVKIMTVSVLLPPIRHRQM